MRNRDPRVALGDALIASEHVTYFLADVTGEEYAANLLLSSAVERQFIVLGEALSRALKADSAMLERLPEVQEVIGFRNVLVHGYDAVEDMSVYDLAREDLPGLMIRIRKLLEEI